MGQLLHAPNKSILQCIHPKEVCKDQGYHLLGPRMIFCFTRCARTQPDKTCLWSCAKHAHWNTNKLPFTFCSSCCKLQNSAQTVLKLFSLLLLIAETELVTISSDVWLFKNSTPELDDTSQKCE